MGISNFVGTFLPFYLGYALFRKSDDFETLAAGLAIGVDLHPFRTGRASPEPAMAQLDLRLRSTHFPADTSLGGYRPCLHAARLAVGQFFVCATSA